MTQISTKLETNLRSYTGPVSLNEPLIGFCWEINHKTVWFNNSGSINKLKKPLLLKI